LIKDLLKRDTTHVTRGSTFDNIKNLAASMVEELRRRYDNTRLGRQELYAEILDDVPGALGTHEELDNGRVLGVENVCFDRKVVSVDPAMTVSDESDETGIAVLGLAGEDVYQLADLSGKFPTLEWGERAVRAAVEFGAGKIVVETNQGGDSNLLILKMAMKNLGVSEYALTVTPVHAKLSKLDRAMPLQMAIQQGTFHIVGRQDELEDQITSWVPTAKKTNSSPDRLDATTHGFNELKPLLDEVFMVCH
jgi:phage terminase large subunit-like protein